MKRWIALLLCGAMALALWGCAAEEEIPGDQALLTVNGEVIFTGQDLENYMIEQEVRYEVRGQAQDSRDEVFREMAERRLLAYAARQLGINADTTFLEEQYDLHMEEIQDTDIYGDELEFAEKLQEALGMDDETFRQWNIDENIIEYDIENLLTDVTDSFSQIQTAEIMEEQMVENLAAFLRMYEIECTYSGMEDWFPTFEYTVLA